MTLESLQCMFINLLVVVRVKDVECLQDVQTMPCFTVVGHLCRCSLVFYARDVMLVRYAVPLCPSVRPFVSHKAVLYRRLNLRSRNQRHTIAQDSSFVKPKILVKFR